MDIGGYIGTPTLEWLHCLGWGMGKWEDAGGGAGEDWSAG